MGNSFTKYAVCVFVLAVLVIMSTAGGLFSASLMTDGDGAMHDCPYMGVTALCDMTPLTHLSQWQGMFASVVQQLSVFTFLLLIALFAARRLVADLFISAASPPGFSRYRHEESLFDPLRLALASGRIHPKSL